MAYPQPRKVIVEITLFRGDRWPVETRQVRDPSWEQIEQCIRDLDQYSYPSLRLGVETDQMSFLDILGGNGKYVLRQPDGGWLYYDPNQGDQEIEVCTSGAGHRCPAFYVCMDMEEVLKIARRFVQTGAFE